MKDFTYIDIDCEFNLHVHDCEWLRDMGLKETRCFRFGMDSFLY